MNNKPQVFRKSSNISTRRKDKVSTASVPERVENDGFALPGDQWRKQRRRVLGNRVHEKVKGHARVKHLFISRVDVSTDDKDLEDMIREKANSRMKSYRVDVALNDAGEIMKPVAMNRRYHT